MAVIASLADLLRERRSLAHEELVEIFVPLLEEMEKAHREGRIHGDVKPSRIERQQDGSYRLAAYGAGKLGTPRYMPPERVRGEKPDARSDIYSIGAVMFEALTGRPVFAGEVNQEIMQAHATAIPQKPSSVKPGVSAELDQVILKALAKRPEDRFQSAREFAAALVKTMPRIQKPVPEQPPAQRTKAAKPAAVEVASTPVRPTPAPVTAVREAGPVPVVRVPVRSRVRLLTWLLPLTLLLAVGTVAFAVRSAKMTVVPELVGLTLVDAESALRGRGLALERGAEVDDSLPQGTVARQSPAPGNRMARGRLVEVQLSTGLVSVPELTGVAEGDARVRLRQSGLSLGVVEQQYSDAVPVGKVIQLTPKTGTRLRAGSVVAMSISAGRATCPSCGKRRERGDMFCTRCGYRF